MLEYTDKTCKDLSDFDNAIAWINERLKDHRLNGNPLPIFFGEKRLCARLSKLVAAREKYLASGLYKERGW